MSQDQGHQIWLTVSRWLQKEHDWIAEAQYARWEEIPGAGRGLTVSKDLPPSKPILEIPPSALLHSRNLQKLSLLPANWFISRPRTRELDPTPGKKQKVSHSGSGNSSTLTSVQLLTTYLAIHRPTAFQEKWKEGGSGGAPEIPCCPWADYLSSLPATFRPWHPLTWLEPTQAESSTAGLKGLVETLPGGARVALKALEERWKFDLKTVREAIEGMDSRQRDEFGLHDLMDEDLLWGWLIVNTRAIYIDLKISISPQPGAPPDQAEQNNLTLCPLIDFANHCHSNNPKACKLVLSPSTSSSSSVKKQMVNWTWENTIIRMIASSCGLKKGEEISFPYGSHSDETLFAEYGFVPFTTASNEDGNPWAEVKVDEWFERELRKLGAEEYEAKKCLLEREGYWSGYTLRRSPAPAHPDNRLLQALRLLHSDDISTNTIHRYLDNPSQPDAPIRLFLQVLSGEREILSEKSEQQARKRLEDYCAELLQDCGEAEKSLDMMRAAESEGFMGVEDWRTAVGTIERLWNSQREIAQAVKNSLEDGVEL